MFKKIIKQSLRKAGYKLKKINPAPVSQDKTDVVIEIYGQPVKVNSANPIASWYQKHPKYNSELARIASAVANKYPGNGIIDIGANVGDTLMIMRSVNSSSFLCIEGDPIVYKYLQENARHFDNVNCLNIFLSDVAENVSVVIEKEGWNTTLIPAAGSESKEIKTFILDEVMQSVDDSDHYKLLKIDTEGFDTRIIRGSIEFIRRVHPVICMEYNRHNMDSIGEDGLSALKLLENLGYRRVLVYESNGRFILPISLSDAQLLRHLHNYIDGVNSTIYYFDLILFHENDEDIALKFIDEEDMHRVETCK
jgi:FkbM family methyltransferase